MKDSQLIIDLTTVQDESYGKDEVVWKVRIINLSNNVFERRMTCNREFNKGEPIRDEIEEDFFTNRQAYKHVGTVGDINRLAMKGKSVTL